MPSTRVLVVGLVGLLLTACVTSPPRGDIYDSRDLEWRAPPDLAKPAGVDFGAWSSYDEEADRHEVQTTWVRVSGVRSVEGQPDETADFRVRVQYGSNGRDVSEPYLVDIWVDRIDTTFAPASVTLTTLHIDGVRHGFVGVDPLPLRDREYRIRSVGLPVFPETARAIADGARVTARIGDYEFELPRSFTLLVRESLEMIGSEAAAPRD